MTAAVRVRRGAMARPMSASATPETCVVITLFAAALLPDRSRAELPATPVLTPVGSRAGGDPAARQAGSG